MKRISEEIQKMFLEEERLQEESHRRTMKKHKEIMEIIERAMKTGKCPFKGKQSCPEDLVDEDIEVDEICRKCIERSFEGE